MFPTPDALKSKYELLDERGKTVELPHQIARLRVWSAKMQAYVEADASLDGAPKDADACRVYWDAMLASLREARGSEYIDEILA